ncbi:MAG: hypothetical protein JSS51_12355 [Planctomycetes bacterium]|nr:hypothetical protein [Planctomycetota bacterium]
MNTRSLALVVFAGSIGALTAQASTVVVTPGNLQGWSAANLRGDGSAAITTTYPNNGDGSLQFSGSTSTPSYKADYVRANTGANLLSTLTSLSVQLYRNSSSTAPAHLAPAVRLFVDNGQATDRYSYLIWEPVYNGVGTVPTDQWNTFDLLQGNFWQRAFKTVGGGQTVEIYNRTLADWLNPGTVTDGGGVVSNQVGPNARVLGYEIGIGSGWNGSFDGAADMFTIGFDGDDTVFNFEPVPAPGATGLLALGGLLAVRRKR